MKKFYFHDGSMQHGPFDLEELRSAGISAQTFIWFDGLVQWTAAGQIKELKPIFSNTTPPPFPEPHASAQPPALPNFMQQKEFAGSQPFKRKPVFITLTVLAACLGIWLFYSYNSHAETLENIREQQEEVDDVVQQIESEERRQKEERKRVNEELTRKNRNYRNNWPDFISASTNNYKYNSLGGISGLEVSVSNRTEYLLDEVTVYVTYVKANGDVWKTIEVPIYNVPAGSERSYSVPDVGRGTSVSLTISGIISKKMHFCYSPGNWANNADDPYFCK
jgi:hypothetical protein